MNVRMRLILIVCFVSLFFVIMSFVSGMKLGGDPRGSVPLFLRKKMYKSIFFTILYLGPHFQKFWAPSPTILH